MAKTTHTVAPPKVIERTMELACQLTHEEFRDRAHRLAKVNTEIDNEEASQESMRKQAKASMSALEAERGRLAEVVSSGEERRTVRVTETHDYVAGEVRVVRDDTMETIERRPLTAPEREISLPLDELQAKGVEVEH